MNLEPTLSKFKNIFPPEKLKKLIYVLYAFLALVTIYHLVFANRIIPGVFVGNVKVGGMTYLQAKKALENYEAKVSKELILKLDNKEYSVKASDINLVHDWDASVTRAFEVGRTGNFITDNKDKLAGFFRKLTIGAFYDYDDTLAGAKFALINVS